MRGNDPVQRARSENLVEITRHFLPIRGRARIDHQCPFGADDEIRGDMRVDLLGATGVIAATVVGPHGKAASQPPNSRRNFPREAVLAARNGWRIHRFCFR